MKKIFTFVVMCLLAATTMMAETVTYQCADATGYPTTSTQSWSVTFDTYTLALEKATGASNPTYNTTGKDVRSYAKNTVTLSTTGNGMTTIVFNISTQGKKRLTDITANAGNVTIDATNWTVTWTGESASSVTFTVGEKSTYGTDGAEKAGQFDFTSFTITTGTGAGTATLVAPSFSMPAGTYYAPFNLTLKCGTPNATIHYTTDGTEPTTASAAYSAPINIAATTTVKALSALDGKTSDVVTAEYVMGTATGVDNIAAYKQLTDGTQAKFNNTVTVLAQNGNNLYVKDETGYALFYGSTGVSYKNGDQIPAGFNGNKTTYNGEPELEVNAYSGFQAATANTPVAPELIQVADIDASMFGHYVVIKGATTSYQNYSITDNSGTAGCRSGMGGFSASADSVNVDVYGMIGAYMAKDGTMTAPEYRILPTRILKAGTDPDADPTLMTIADYQNADDNANVTIKNDVTVIAQKGSYLYVKDETGYMLVYGSTGKSYTRGDIIPAGFKGVKVTYNGEPELKTPSNFQEAKGNNAITAEEIDLTAANVAHANFGHFVHVKSVTLNTTDLTLTDAAGNTAAYFSNMGASLPTDLTKKYNVYAVVGSHYNSSTQAVDYQIIPLEFTLENGDPLPVDDVANIAALYALPTGTNARVTGEITAIYQKGAYLYVKDATNYALIYGSADGQFQNGDKMVNVVANWTTYDGYKEIIPVANTVVKSGEGEAVAPEELTFEDLSQDMVHQYVLINDVTVKADTIANTYICNDGTIDMTVFNKFGVNIAESNSHVSIKGFVAIHSGKLQVIVTEVVGNNTTGDVNTDGTINSSDVSYLVNKILAGEACDVNSDGETNSSDVSYLVNLILSNN